MTKPCVQYVILGVLIAIAWTIVTLPIILYHLPVSMMDHTVYSNRSTEGKGRSPFNYTMDNVAAVNESCPLCFENFYCKPGSHSCVPNCDWTEYTEPTNTIINVFVIVICSMSVLFGVLTLTLAVVRRNRMCSFPSVIVIYQTVAALIISIFVLLGYMNQKSLYCWASNDLAESVTHSTPFCVISGIAILYLLMFLSLCWICHISIMYWKLQFPFHARNFAIDGKMKYIHITCVIAIILLSSVPVISIILVDWRQRQNGENVMGTLGFGITRFQPITCTAMNRNSLYYSLVLPINLMVPVGVTLLILILWIIHKNYKMSKETDEKQGIKISSAESKILFILCYYVVMTVIALSGLTIISWKGPAFVQAYFHYFLCERAGYNPDSPCDRSKIDDLHQAGLVAISFIFVGLFPVINFIFTANFREIANALTKCCHRKQEIERNKERQSLINKDSVKSHSDTEYSTEHED